MNDPSRISWHFGPYRLDRATRTLYRGGGVISLEPKVAETLVALVSAAGRVVLKDEILEAVWPGLFVEEGSLVRNVSILRKVLGTQANGQSYIETLAKRGYRFTATVQAIPTLDGDEGTPDREPASWALIDEPSEGEPSPVPAPSSPSREWAPSPSRRWSSVRRFGSAAGALAALGLVVAAWHGIRTPTLADTSTERLTFDVNLTIMPALSRDGTLLAYASDRAGRGDLDIWLQQPGGVAPLRLTSNEEDDEAPDFSPDGHWIAFRSDREPRGVYMMPSLGGEARLVVGEGRRPRFSPDGTHIAYWVGVFRGPAAQLPSEAYVVPVHGGTPRRLLEGFDVARDLVWAPDGRGLIALAKPRGGTVKDLDWWWVSADGDQKRRTHAFDRPGFRAAAAGAPTTIEAGAWTDAGVIFTFRDNLWALPMSNEGIVRGDPHELTHGAGPYADVAASRSGDVAFVVLEPHRVVELASLLSPDTPPRTVYSDARLGFERTTQTGDGSTIVIERVPKAGIRRIVSRRVDSGEERQIAEVESPNRVNATVSLDGRRIVYTTTTSGNARLGQGFVVRTADGIPRQVCTGCMLYGFSSDNRRVLAVVDGEHAISWIDTDSAEAVELVRTREPATLDRPHMAPNDQFLAFREQVADALRTFLVDVKRPGAGSHDRWRQIDDPTMTGRPLGWSEDSNVLYLFSESDGFRCVWGQRVDAVTGRLQAKPTPVRHWHRSLGLGLSTGFGNAVAAGSILYEYSSRVGNVWRLSALRAAP